MQLQALDLSTSGLPERKEQPEAVPTGQTEQMKHPPATVATEKPHSGRRRNVRPAAGGEGQEASKKAKVTDGVEVLTTGHAEREPTNPDEPSAIFVPDFECPDGHVITVGDSLEDSPLLAMTLLKDMDNLPIGKAKTMAELCLLLAKVCTPINIRTEPFQKLNPLLLQAGQCASRAFSDMDVLLETNRSLRGDLQAQRKEMERSIEEVETLEAKVAECDIMLIDDVQIGKDEAELIKMIIEDVRQKKRKEKSQVTYERKKQLTKLRLKAEKVASCLVEVVFHVFWFLQMKKRKEKSQVTYERKKQLTKLRLKDEKTEVLQNGFANHEKLFREGSDGKVKKWRKALTEAANLSCQHLLNEANGDEAELIKMIIKDVREKGTEAVNGLILNATDVQVNAKPFEKMDKLWYCEHVLEVQRDGMGLSEVHEGVGIVAPAGDEDRIWFPYHDGRGPNVSFVVPPSPSAKQKMLGWILRVLFWGPPLREAHDEVPQIFIEEVIFNKIRREELFYCFTPNDVDHVLLLYIPQDYGRLQLEGGDEVEIPIYSCGNALVTINWAIDLIYEADESHKGNDTLYQVVSI
ncbi:hypothetical protein RHSIM_Rhsim01G0093300 [Rhododendron simsii]|uniref:Uncharacterized protein n=1 Tax=Rhododendron simsii TaxID=118357 RepID=A0A834HHH4_RHOSS|nr:hypothetical protein RHSIM_Rhsim01G0093300 [Rhododendron simsii]